MLMSKMKQGLNSQSPDRKMPSNTPNPVPLTWTPELVERFWTLASKSSLAELSFSRRVAGELVRFVSTQVSPSARLLDFGAGDGDLAKALLDAGYQVAVYEPSQGRRETILANP